MNPRNLDAVVARLLGLDVLGEVPCLQFDNHYIVQRTFGDPDTMQAAYLNECFCHLQIDGSIRYFGHIQSCLKVVPFYHRDDTLARMALERVCDERKLVPRLLRTLDKKWIVTLETTWPHSGEETVRVEDKSLPLAIVKALAGLERKK